MHEVDDVKRALVRGPAKAVAQRTGLPVAVVMSIASANGWDVDKAEAIIEDAMRDVARTLTAEMQHEILYGGGPGGGKQAQLSARGQSFISRIDTITGRLDSPRGLVTSCVS